MTDRLEIMPSDIRNICIDCADPWELARFWSAALGRPVLEENEPGDDEVGIPLDDHGGELILLRVPEEKVVKNRVHVCLQPQGARDEEIERLLGLGASMYDDRRTEDGAGWAVLTDPVGNEFCVLRSAAERAATG